MKKWIRSLSLLLSLVALTAVISGCGSTALSSRNVWKTDQKSKTITWGLKRIRDYSGC
ncbi:hypothetical protein L3X07_00525 [Levilactobacillus brevis]|nr:hypothetical protein [Levilactobacillus brevis]